MRREHGRWHGPARVAMVEGLTHANKLIRASPEQLRPASLREWKAVKASEEAKLPMDQLLKRAGHQDYFDLGGDLPGLGDVVSGDVSITAEAESLPEPESAPSVVSGETGTLPESGHVEEPTIPVGGLHVPVPNTDDEDETAWFGDVCDFGSGFGKSCWEIDVTPESNWDPSQLGLDIFHSSTVTVDEMILLATEQRKKRVECDFETLEKENNNSLPVRKTKRLKHGFIMVRFVR